MIPDVCVSMVIHHYFGIKNLKIWDLKDMYQTENSTAQSSGEGQAITKKKSKSKDRWQTVTSLEQKGCVNISENLG